MVDILFLVVIMLLVKKLVFPRLLLVSPLITTLLLLTQSISLILGIEKISQLLLMDKQSKPSPSLLPGVVIDTCVVGMPLWKKFMFIKSMFLILPHL